ncbi:hypothetical protein [Tsukamurella soli]|uniref:DUF2867 domain-containing protein n=1 Tax=Tsukamurella soli TaxID=644556 RepID=A0ABP8J6G1_9ACTN
MTTAEPVEIAPPAKVTELQLFDRVDYQDAYSVDTTVDRTPEQWMRAFVEDAPIWFKVPWAGVGKVLLGARFGPLTPTSGYIVGWKVLDDRPDVFVVGLDSAGGLLARMVAVTTPGQAVVATQISLDSAYARALWPVIRRGHRFFAPYLLGRAAASLQGRKSNHDDTKRV